VAGTEPYAWKGVEQPEQAVYLRTSQAVEARKVEREAQVAAAKE